MTAKSLPQTTRILTLCLLALVAFLPVLMAVQVLADESSQFSRYSLPGKPKHVVVETPERLWYTLPDADKVVLLSGNDVIEYQTGNGSKPYDLLISDGYVWVTLSGSNAIGRIAPLRDARSMPGNMHASVKAAFDLHLPYVATYPKVFEVYPIPTANSEPTGIVAGGGYIWFVERKGDNLGRLDPATGQMSEYTDKNPNDDNLVDMRGAQLESVAYSADGVWFTGPTFVSSVALFRPKTETFTAAPAGSDAEPMAIAIDNSGDTWIVSRGTNRLGRFGLNTLGVWQWYALPASVAGPDNIFIREANGRREIWYSRSGVNRIGAQYVTFTGVPITQIEGELPVSDATPWGVSVDDNGRVWIAPSGVNEAITWNTPYFQQFLYVPSMRRP